MSLLEWVITFAIFGLIAWIGYDRRKLTKVVKHRVLTAGLLKRYDLSGKTATLIRQDRIINREFGRLKDRWRI